ncbi:MAG: MerR family DNA-binding transcriptional regulator [Paracoccus sp. (in: a-proteobacteria)]|nr:MerR family DNA-binding transcriptional regulator [Paracoccus sp. (in: a-proteobacteria)]
MSDEFLTIRRMCDQFEVTPRTLRFYESRGLLAPRRDGQHRYYGRSDRARLTLILRGKRFGFSLDEIGELLDLYDPGERNITQIDATITASKARLDGMIRQHQELGDAITDMERQIAQAEHILAGLHKRAAG